MDEKKGIVRPGVADEGLGLSLEQALDGVEDEVLVVDSEYRVHFANSAMRHRLGTGSEPYLGRPCYEIFEGRSQPCSMPPWDCPLTKVMASGVQTAMIHPMPDTQADIHVSRYVQLAMYPLRDRRGRVTAAVCLRRDVTAERQLETEVLTRHHQLVALNRISSAVSGLSQLDEILKVALDTVLEIIQGTIGEILLVDKKTQRLQSRVQRGLSMRFVQEMQLQVGEGITGTVAQGGEAILVQDISQDPRTAHVELVSAEGLRGFVSVPLKAKHEVVGVMNIASHLPGQFAKEDMYLLEAIGYQLGTAIEQARLYERLRDTSERYQRLLQHVLTAQEDERKRIARELHDGTSQMLTGLSLNLQAAMDLAAMVGMTDERIHERLEKAHSLALQTSTEVTKLINDLRPTLLDSLGLAPAIQRYVETWLQPKGIDTSVKTKGHERLPSEIEVALFRIAQEAVNNVMRHSEAKKVAIDLQCDDEKCVLRIQDDGRGFDVQEITKVDKTGRGVGLFGMKERVTLVGGSCHIESQPGKGTTIISEVPLTGSRDNAEDKSAGR